MQVAGLSGVSKRSVSDWEASTSPTAEKLGVLAKFGFDVQFICTGVRSAGAAAFSDSEQPVLTSFEWKLLKKVRALGEPHQKQVLAMLEVISAGVSLGGNTTVITGDNKRVAGRDYNDNRSVKLKPKK